MITKKLKLSSEQGLDATTFKLPENLEYTKVKFAVIARTPVGLKWEDIVKEREEFGQECNKYEGGKLAPVPPPTPFHNTERQYVKQLFENLVPAVIETLEKAKIWKCFYTQKCFFNGIDHVAELLWKNNPRFPQRKDEYSHILYFPWVRDHLKEHPRPFYPKSWLWTEEYAASLIQRHVRKFFVQRDVEVQEMRDFWIKIKTEEEVPQIELNPLLSKMFAKSAVKPRRSEIPTPAKNANTNAEGVVRLGDTVHQGPGAQGAL